jgi:hypothetical protein
MTCSTRVYQKNEFGFTRKCSCHNAVHLNFGTISLLLTLEHFQKFASYITNTLEIECSVYDYDERCIYLPTRDNALMFALTYNELRLLSDVLDTTLVMIEVDHVLAVDNG